VPAERLLAEARARRDSAAGPAADSAGPTPAQGERSRVEPWAVRREYRHTYRSGLTDTERVVRGRWWPEAPPEPGLARVSAEEDVARSLGVDLGDRITWDVQGTLIESVITSIRAVDWTRFETNFFFVFEPAALAGAPQSWVALARVDSADARAAVQRELVLAHPNVSVIDLAVVQDALARIIGRVSLAIRFMALFSVLSGIVVLIAALAAGRFARLRETALLRTMGARNRQVRRILLTEYAALGTLGGLTGCLLGGTAGYLLVHYLYRLDFRLPVGSLLAAWGSAVLLAMAIGTLLGRDALKRPPLATLREAGG
jgi:putative ABC transport system permease protein